MPLIANNITVTTNSGDIKEKINLSIAEKKEQIVTNEDINKDHAILVVNGKNKKIGKKSQYLLDMLTLDDD